MVSRIADSCGVFVAGVLTTSMALCNDGGEILRPELQPLAFLVGSCWSGKFPDDDRVDTHCFESLFAGKHFRDRHEVVGGDQPYLGESVYSWSEDSGKITYVYWNSYGGVSSGTAVPGVERITFPDESYEGPDGANIVISSHWEEITTTSYDSVITEKYEDGSSSETRIRFERQ